MEQAPQGGAPGGGGDIGTLIQGVGEGLTVLAQSAQQQSPEAAQAFQQALQAFEAGLQAMQSGPQQQTPAQGAVPPNPQMQS